MKYPREFIDKVKDATDIVELAQEYTEIKKVGRYVWLGKCPHPKHQDDTASFMVREDTQSWCCFGCHSEKKDTEKKKGKNYGSDCIALIQWLNDDKLTWTQSFEFVAKRAGIPLPTPKNNQTLERNKRLQIKYTREMSESAKAYCIARGLDSYDIAKYGLGYDKVEDRLTFPLYDAYNNVVGFNKRRMDGINDIKYKHSSNDGVFNKSSYLYNINNIDKTCEYIFVTEGVFDVILASKYGLPNVVCTLGCSFSESHYDAIVKMGLTPVLLYDNDDKGQQSIRSAAELIYQKGIYPLVYILPSGLDLADFASEKKYRLKNTVHAGIMTYGYLLSKDVISEYMSELYLLKAKYRPRLKEVLAVVPEDEKQEIETFLKEEIRM